RIFFFFFFITSIFFIVRNIFVKKDGFKKNFKHGILTFVGLSLMILLTEHVLKIKAIYASAMTVHLLAFLYSWNPIILSTLMLKWPFPLNILAILFSLSVFAFYELAYLIVKQRGLAKFVFVSLILLFSFSAVYYFLLPAKNVEAVFSETGSYVFDVSANPLLDAAPIAEILRLNGIEARWEDRWEHGPLLVKADYKDVVNLKYRWIKSVTPYPHKIESNFIALLPSYLLSLLRKNYLWISLLFLVLFWYIRRHAIHDRSEHTD
ncbi:MAG: hypothetical protein D6733_05115, partial [Methanobacteriota archaeon]